MLTVAYLIDSFESVVKAHVGAGITAAGTAAWYHFQLQKLNRVVGGFPAAELRAHHLTGVKFTHHFIRALKRLYRWAHEEELVPRDPFKKLKTPRCGSRKRVLTRSEMARLYRASPVTFRRLLFAAKYTMARPGEVRRLRWRDVCFTDRLILLYEFKAKDRRGDGAEVRRIPIAVPLLRLLRNMHRRAADQSPAALVFTNRHGREFSSNAVRCAMRKARKRAGLEADDRGERIVCYSLRHTSATNAVRNDVGTQKVADILGHADLRTTRRYLHLAGQDLVDVIDQAVSRPKRPSK